MNTNPTPSDKEAFYWRTLLVAMAGVQPPPEVTYHEREEMKQFASAIRGIEVTNRGKIALAWLLHCLAHYLRAHEQITLDWPEFERQEEFKYGITFRRYLGAWLWSVGKPQLNMTIQDLEAVHEATGVSMLPHELLPLGRSEFVRPSGAA